MHRILETDYAFVLSTRIHKNISEDNNDDEDGRNEVGVVPDFCKVLLHVIFLLLYFSPQEVG